MHKLSFILYIIFVLVLKETLLSAQDLNEIKRHEDSLKIIVQVISATQDDSLKLLLNKKFSVLLDSTLTNLLSFEYPFDSLKSLGKLTSPDKRFRMYLWALHMNDGSYHNFGFIQQPKPFRPEIIALSDRSDSIENPEIMILQPDNWYGALYYKIIPVKTASGTYYTLLGWFGNNSVVTQKIIDVLSFNSDGLAIFGARVFNHYAQGENTRIIFRYSAQTSMMLKYDKQMIVFDRLIPLDAQLEGLYQHYVPESDVYDGLNLEYGKWNFVKGIKGLNKH